MDLTPIGKVWTKYRKTKIKVGQAFITLEELYSVLIGELSVKEVCALNNIEIQSNLKEKVLIIKGFVNDYSMYEGLREFDLPAKLVIDILTPSGLLKLVAAKVARLKKIKIRETNPKFRKKKGRVFLGSKLSNNLATEEIAKNAVTVGPFGDVAAVFGYDPNTYLLYLMEDSSNMPKLQAAILGESKDAFPLFPIRVPYGVGAIDMFWQQRLAKLMAGAVQYVITNDRIIITHMAVKTKWRRHKLNTKMIQLIVQKYPSRTLSFLQVTEDGRKFVESFGGEIIN